MDDHEDRSVARRLAREPTLFFSIYVHKRLPGHHLEEDPRLVVLKEADNFAGSHELTKSKRTSWRYCRAVDIDLVAVDRSPPEFQGLLNLQPPEPANGMASRIPYWCLVYTHLDALVVQIMIGKFDPWKGSLLEGWEKLVDDLRAHFHGGVLEAARPQTFGASVVYWAMADDGSQPSEYADEVSTIVTKMEGLRPLYTRTDLGPLWESDVRTFPQAARVSQDLWILVTPRSPEIEEEVNRRYNLPQVSHRPDFAAVALARHKVAFEWGEYERETGHLDHLRRSLDRRSRWMVDAQRYYAEEVGELGSRTSRELQEKLGHATTNLADYHQTATQVKALRRTVNDNRENFLVNSIALISAAGAEQVAASVHQVEAATAFLTQWAKGNEEGIFRRELGRMRGLCDQLDTDVDYSDLVVERHIATLGSGTNQIQLAGQRQLAEIGHHIGVETAAVVASLAAVIAVELLKPGEILATENKILYANLLLLVVTGAFALVLLLAGQTRSNLERGSFALAIGFLAGSLVSLRGEANTPALSWIAVGAIVGGTLFGRLVHGVLEMRAHLRQRQRRRPRTDQADALDKLTNAAEEVPELLEALPAAATFHVEDEKARVAMVERVNAEEATRRGITPAELKRQGADYKVDQIKDAIAIRYVVPPWQVAEVVDRIKAVARPVGIDYKNETTVPGSVVQVVDGKNVEVEDSQYAGKYRGFRGSCRSVHVDLDLRGVGARKDLCLLAEIQVRTPIQNLYADWFHDIMQDESPPPGVPDTAQSGTAPWLVRFFDRWHPGLNRVLAHAVLFAGDVELWLFRDVMEWSNGTKDRD